jgi:hypothetical protein
MQTSTLVDLLLKIVGAVLAPVLELLIQRRLGTSPPSLSSTPVKPAAKRRRRRKR